MDFFSKACNNFHRDKGHKEGSGTTNGLRRFLEANRD